MANELERGDLFVFYRPKVGADDPSEVQRLYLVLVNSSHYRLLLVGANALPANESSQKPAARRWLQVRAAEKRSTEIEKFLQGGDYQTKTCGEQHLPPAAPVGEGRYALIDTGESTHLVCRLQRPKDGELAETLGLREEASYVVSIKNPDVPIEGFPEERPDYPDQLAKLFQNRRWIPVRNSGLLNYVNAQLIFINAAGDQAAREFDLALEPEKADVRATIDLDLPEEGLLEGRFPDLASFQERHHGEISPDFGAGGARGGREAARSSDSASAVARLLKGLEFPATKMTALRRARANQHD